MAKTILLRVSAVDWSTGKFQNDLRGVSAVEFAFVSPIFLLLVFGILAFSTILGTCNGLQQLVAEAARASVAGISDAERDQIARDYIGRNAASYPFIDPARLSIETAAEGAGGKAYQVTIHYDMSQSFVFKFGEMLPLPSPIITREAAILRGGY